MRDCVLNLLGKATESFEKNLDLNSFLDYYTNYTSKSLNAQSACFFRYNKNSKSVRAKSIEGVFPSLIKAPEHMINALASTPTRLRNYLYDTEFKLVDTPFVEAVDQQHAVQLDETAVNERLKSTIIDCWGMLVIPLIVDNSVFGVLAIVNRNDKKRFDAEDLLLANNLAEMAGIVVNHILSFKEIQDKRQQDRQLQIASVIQNHLLPQSLPSTDFYDIAVRYKTAFRVSGDYYDFIDVDDDHLGIVVADVSGKGSPAGLVMATTRSLFSVIAKGETSPSKTLVTLNNYLIELIPQDMFVSIVYVIFNKNSGEFIYARAGHEYILFCSKNNAPVNLGSGAGMVVGMLDNSIFETTLMDETYKLNPGDFILLYTDGLTEALNPAGEEFGAKNLNDVIKVIKNMNSDSALECLMHRVKRFTEGEPAYDDVTAVMIKAKE
jgi:sigma-B regulation protein RsbU (phosphoserine phosphatase)